METLSCVVDKKKKRKSLHLNISCLCFKCYCLAEVRKHKQCLLSVHKEKDLNMYSGNDLSMINCGKQCRRENINKSQLMNISVTMTRNFLQL